MQRSGLNLCKRFSRRLVDDVIRVLLGQRALELVSRGVEICPQSQVADPAMNAIEEPLHSIEGSPTSRTKLMHPV